MKILKLICLHCCDAMWDNYISTSMAPELNVQRWNWDFEVDFETVLIYAMCHRGLSNITNILTSNLKFAGHVILRLITEKSDCQSKKTQNYHKRNC